MSGARGTVRREVRIARSPAQVWEAIGDPAKVHEWFPGTVACTVEGDQRVVTTGSGLPIPEQLLTVDPLQHRIQYRITAPIVREHLSTLDVFDLEDGTSLVAYSADADPSVMALVIAGAAGNALRSLRDRLEGASIDDGGLT